MSEAAQGELPQHEVFSQPFKVEPVYEWWETPDNYRGYPGGKELPAKLKVWRVQQTGGPKDIFIRPYGAVARPWSTKEAPGTEILVAGYNTGKMSGAVAVGRHNNFLQWGFSAPPSKMTQAGQKFFLNCICYIAKFEAKDGAKAVSKWKERFAEVYRLDDREILKRIAPPFIAERLEFYRSAYSQQAETAADPPDYFNFYWDKVLSNSSYGFVSGGRQLSEVLRHSLGLRADEFAGPENLLSLKVPGDWIVRSNATREDLLKALATILRDELKTAVRFVKQTSEQEVIVVSGRFELQPLPDYSEGPAVHFYVDQLNPPRMGGGGSGTLEEMLAHLGDRIHQRIINETQEASIQRIAWRYHRSSQYQNLQAAPGRLDTLLENLARQTALRFRKEKRLIEIWSVQPIDP